MSSSTTIGRHRAATVRTGRLSAPSSAVAGNTGAVGRQAAVTAAASGPVLTSGIAADAATPISSAPRRLRPFATPLLALAVVTAWIASVSVGSTITVDPLISRFAVIIHIMSLVLSFGAILVLDWVGFLWLTGRRRLHETSRLESAAGPLIWGGIVGLLASGALVHPNITSPITELKMGAVLALLLNGILLMPFMRRLHAMPHGTRFADMPLRINVRLIASLTISQVSWWTAIVVGFINSVSRG